MNPMKKKKLIKSDQFPILFSNVESLLPIHTQLLTRLEECYAAWPNSHLGSAFLKAIPSMRKYSSYVNNFRLVYTLALSSLIACCGCGWVCMRERV
jgi:RhoGEF domain